MIMRFRRNFQVARRATHGYSIVEMGIVLATLGLLLGASLVPLGNRLRAERVADARDQLEQIRTAIVGYARTHRNNPAVAVITGTNYRATIPGGRPYLPCPDQDGDGQEDRYPMPPGDFSTNARPAGTTVTDLPLTGPISLAVPEILPITVTVSDARADNDLVPTNADGYGMCVSDRGMVPWATLGTPPADPWGNRFTYRVDPIFAHGVLGFGRESRSDMLDPRMPLTTTISSNLTLTTYMRREEEYFNGRNMAPGITLTTLIDELPGLVCNTIADSTGCSLESLRNGDLTGNNLLVATTTGASTVFNVLADVTVARVYEDNDITSGMVFTVLSHGANGFGAYPHNEGANRSTSTNDLICLDLPNPGNGWSASHPETENADVVNIGTCVVVNNRPPNNTNTGTPHYNSFAELPIARTGSLEFDDVLIHMSDQELIGAMHEIGIDMDRPWVPPGPM